MEWNLALVGGLRLGGDDWVQLLSEEAASRQGRGTKLYVAQVPALLRRSAIDIRSIAQGRKLLELIRSEAANTLSPRLDPDVQGGWYLEPKNGFRPENSPATPAPERAESPSISNTRRFVRPFWTAFIKRIPEGHRRFVSMDGLKFQDLPESVAEPERMIEVLPSELSSVDPLLADDNPAAIQAAIEKWASTRKVNLDNFLLRADRELRRNTISESQRWLLGLEGLSQTDKSRINIPLDIVLKLLTTL